MQIKITSEIAKTFASLIINDIRDYVLSHSEEYASFIANENKSYE